MSEYEISSTEYVAPDGARYRVRILQDPDASSPRENDNPTVIHTFDSHWISPDGEPERNGSRTPRPLIPGDYLYGNQVDMRRARRWVNLFGKAEGILAIAGVERIQGGWAEGGLRITEDDDRAVGYVAITAKAWEMCMGDTPLEGDPAGAEHRSPSATEVMAQDVAEYSRWAAGEYVGFVAGEYVGFVVERAVTWVPKDSIDCDGAPEMVTWEQLEDGALGGIDDEAYALTKALMYLPTGSVPTV